MRVLFDITHPAQVHFFKHLIWLLRQRGDDVLVATRRKDVTLDLLDSLRIPYRCLSEKGSGMVGMARELLVRYVRLLELAREFRPDVMLAQTGVSIGLVGAVLRVPRLVLEEAEHARLQQMLGLPFASSIFTGTGYTKSYGHRQVQFKGIWVQSYLHPNYFTPSVEPLMRAGIDPEKPYIVVRTVSWGAAHDVGLPATSETDIISVVQRLSRHGRVLISSEGPLPGALAAYANPVPVEHMHHLLAHAAMYIGEGGTMAAEAAVLGTPAVFCNHLRVGYLLALEKRYGLAYNTNSLLEGLPLAEKLLAQPDSRHQWRKRHQRLMAESEDVTAFVLRLIDQTVSEHQQRKLIRHRGGMRRPRLTPPAAPPKKLIVLPVVAGIGNALMAVPLARQLKRALPGHRLCVVARIGPMGEVFQRLPEVDEVVVVGNPVKNWMQTMLGIRARCPELCVVPFPSNRWQYSVVAQSSGAARCLIHGYPVGRTRTLAFLAPDRVEAVRGIHDVAQNLRLLEAIGIKPDYDEKPTFAVHADDRARAARLLQQAGVPACVRYVAVHAGSAKTILAQAKRWPTESYAQLLARLEHDLGQAVVLLEGPDERGVSDEILRHATRQVPVVRLGGPLADAAAVLERAALYVGSDSGLAHLSAAVGTVAVTLFAPADPDRVCPSGYRDLVVQSPRPCAPCFAYPWRSPYPKIDCRDSACIREISVDSVLAAVRRGLARAGTLVGSS